MDDTDSTLFSQTLFYIDVIMGTSLPNINCHKNITTTFVKIKWSPAPGETYFHKQTKLNHFGSHLTNLNVIRVYYRNDKIQMRHVWKGIRTKRAL